MVPNRVRVSEFTKIQYFRGRKEKMETKETF